MGPRLFDIVSATRTLCLNVADPGWDDARGNLFDREARAVFFPVSRKYLEGRDPNAYEVLIWGQPRVRAIGRLSIATSATDIETQRRLATGDGFDPAEVEVMVFEQRHHKARKNRYKLQLERLAERSAQ